MTGFCFNPRPAGAFRRTHPLLRGAFGVCPLLPCPLRSESAPSQPARWRGGADSANLPNSRSSGPNEAGEAAIESSQRVLFWEVMQIFIRNIASWAKVSSKVRTVTFCLIVYRDMINYICEPNLHKNPFQMIQRYHLGIGRM